MVGVNVGVSPPPSCGSGRAPPAHTDTDATVASIHACTRVASSVRRAPVVERSVRCTQQQQPTTTTTTNKYSPRGHVFPTRPDMAAMDCWLGLCAAQCEAMWNTCTSWWPLPSVATRERSWCGVVVAPVVVGCPSARAPVCVMRWSPIGMRWVGLAGVGHGQSRTEVSRNARWDDKGGREGR